MKLLTSIALIACVLEASTKTQDENDQFKALMQRSLAKFDEELDKWPALPPVSTLRHGRGVYTHPQMATDPYNTHGRRDSGSSNPPRK
jgi:hypothetical protein